MDWQRVGKRMLGFVIGAGGVAVAVIVVLPWFEASDKAANGPQSHDSIMEKALASFSEPGTGDGAEKDERASDPLGLTTIPSPWLPIGAGIPVPVLSMAKPAEVATEPLYGGTVQSSGLAKAPSPEDAVVSVSACEAAPSEIGQHAEIGSDAVKEDTPSEAARAVELPAPEEHPPGVWIEAEAVEAHALETAEYVSEEQELAPDAQPNFGKAFQRWIALGASSGAGVPRREFEMPAGIRTVKTPLRTGDKADGSRPVPPATPLNEFSPRGIAFSDARAASGTAVRSTGRSDPVQVPGTLRGVMGYRLPLVGRQELPDQVVSGVLIPAHTTYVILQPGYWELVGLSPGDVKALRAAVEKAEADQRALQSRPAARGWNPFRFFRRNQTPAGGN